ncbi:AraC family transcriptional regulator [Caballeronia glebae]|nr:AraC family transcriptional regulator [Caballeronia glebae]
MASHQTESGTDWARFLHGTGSGITLMQAHFTEHSFERHSHATYSIGVTQSGVQKFNCRGTQHASLKGDVMLFNPDEPHDGSRGTDEGFGYAILYVEPALLETWFDRSAGTVVSRYFTHTVVNDGRASRLLSQAVAALSQPQESMSAEVLTSASLIHLLAKYGEYAANVQACIDPGRRRMVMVREFIDAHFQEDLTVDLLGRLVGLSRVHLTRAFSSSFGVPPHIYLNMVRLRQAQSALLSGHSLADAAISAGFADQSHFSRRFKGSVGLSPGAWLKQVTST